MSMSLAPSPTAMVRASGTPAAAAKRVSASAFPARSTIGPRSSPVMTPVVEHELVGGEVIDAELRTSASMTWVNPPLTTAIS